jgi:hypothetical protein
VSKEKKISKHIHTSFNLSIQRIGLRHPNPKRDKERGGGEKKPLRQTQQAKNSKPLTKKIK